MSASERFDYLIVGSGVSAATIADRLISRRPDASVLMLEAGQHFELADRRTWWDFVTTGVQPTEFAEDIEACEPGSTNRVEGVWGFKESRLMVRGGTTNHWGGWSLRLKPEDFHLQQNTGWGANWLFPYDELVPFYDRAESLLGVNTANDSYHPGRPPPFPFVAAAGPFIKAFEQLGLSYGPMPIARYRHCMTTGTCKYCPFGARYAAPFVLDSLERKGNLVIRTHSAVSKIIMESRKIARGVEYVTSDGQRHVALGRRIIIAAGSYESPKLLLRSKPTYWPNGVGNDYDLVGRYLVGHRLLRVTGALPKNPHRWQQALDFPTIISRHYDTPDEQRRGKLFMFRARGRPKTDIVKMMRSGYSSGAIANATVGPMEMRINGFMEDFGRYENRVENAAGQNSIGLTGTLVKFVHQAGFMERAAERMRLMARVLQKMGCGNIGAEVVGARGDHASGTCRMGRSPEEGVVDQNLRVFSTENVYICSNAVFPSLGADNPTLTLTAMSIRMADHLLS